MHLLTSLLLLPVFGGVLVLAGGLFPNAVLDLTRVASQDWVSHLTVQ